MAEGAGGKRGLELTAADALAGRGESFEELEERCKKAPRYGANAKFLLLQAASRLATEGGGLRFHPPASGSAPRAAIGAGGPDAAAHRSAPPQPGEASEAPRRLHWKQLPGGLLQCVPKPETPIVAFVLRPKIPRALRQGVANHLANQHLAMAAAAHGVLSAQEARTLVEENADLRAAAMKAALAQELDLYKRSATKALYSTSARTVTASADFVQQPLPTKRLPAGAVEGESGATEARDVADAADPGSGTAGGDGCRRSAAGNGAELEVAEGREAEPEAAAELEVEPVAAAELEVKPEAAAEREAEPDAGAERDAEPEAVVEEVDGATGQKVSAAEPAVPGGAPSASLVEAEANVEAGVQIGAAQVATSVDVAAAGASAQPPEAVEVACCGGGALNPAGPDTTGVLEGGKGQQRGESIGGGESGCGASGEAEVGKADSDAQTGGNTLPDAISAAAAKESRGKVKRRVAAFVRGVLDPVYAQNLISRQDFKTVAQKVVNKVMSAHVDATDDAFIAREDGNIRKLITQYLKQYLK
eukprot:jgi/Tetstr1/430782/TSEL_020567.t1